MKYIVRKAYWDHEKEEEWLNQMAVKGMALIDYSWCRYVFVDSKNGEYIYRIELLENLPSHPESQAYIRFMEESGVECISTYMRWIYFRKKAADGSFNIYSDKDSMITHYKRINTMWTILALVETIIGTVNIFIGAINLMHGIGYGSTNIGIGIALVVFGVFINGLGSKARKKIRKLKKEKMICE